VLAVGRLSHEKAVANLVAAVAELHRPGIRLVVVGDGPERASIQRAAQITAIRIHMPGHVNDVAPFYAVADVLALPSLSEGSPNALLEAMAAGVPVAATAVGGVPEIVANEESALLVPPRDTGALAQAIARLLDEAALARRIAAKAHDLALGRFSPEARTARLIEIYSAAANQPAAAHDTMSSS
jgi:glycosyltransferase involved in cell wall biosynthesis